MSQPPIPVLDLPARPALPSVLNRVAFWAVISVVVIGALAAGLVLRRYAWDETEPIRYTLDINNAYRQGSISLSVDYIDRYDERTSQSDTSAMLDLDYAPGRLAIATLWARWVREQPEWDSSRLRGGPEWQQEFYFYSRARELQRQELLHPKHPPGFSWTYELVKPLLMVNLTGEILSAIAMFFLVRRYTAGKPPNLRPTRGIVLGLTSALLFWFNPALIWNAHCWPQWDSWVLPFFLWAVLLASLDWWFCAGAIIAAGAMFKGQILFGAPLFLLWPLFQGRLPAMLRWIAGLLASTAAITGVWAVRIPGTNPTGVQFIPGSVNWHAVEWIVTLALIFAAMTSLLWAPKKSYIRPPLGMAIAAVLSWIIAAHTTHAVLPILAFLLLSAAGWYADTLCLKLDWRARLPMGGVAVLLLIYPIFVLTKSLVFPIVLAMGALGLMLLFAPRKAIAYAAAAWVGGAVLLCTPIFGTSHGWFDLGIALGTHHFEKGLARGEPNNLAELLEKQWDWTLMEPAFSLPGGVISQSMVDFLKFVDPGLKNKQLENSDDTIDVPLKYVLFSVWVVSVILSSIGAAMHDARRSPRFLAAISTPWIMLFAVMAQMHQRYLLWGASLSAATAVLNIGFALLHVFLSFVAMGQEMHTMLGDTPRYQSNEMYQFLDKWHPGVAWAVLMCAGVFLYTTLKIDRSVPKRATKE